MRGTWDSRAGINAKPNEYTWLDDLTSVPTVSHAGTGETESKVERQKAKSRPDRVFFDVGKAWDSGTRGQDETGDVTTISTVAYSYFMAQKRY